MAIDTRSRHNLTLVLIGLTLLQGVAAAQPEVGSPAAVLFERGGDLYAVSVDGSRTVRLTKTRVSERDPAVSRNGRSIAYTVQRANRWELWTMNVNRREPTRILSSRSFIGSPEWSPDARTIFFSFGVDETRFATCSSIFRLGTNGRGLQRVTRFQGHLHTDPAVSPDGRRVAFTDWNACEGGTASTAVHVVDMSGRRTKDLSHLPGNRYYPTREYGGPSWSPDGDRLALLTSPGPVVVRRNGTGLRRLRLGRLITGALAWSPDGRWIAFVALVDNGMGNEVYVVHPDGQGLRRLTHTQARENSPAWLHELPLG